MDKRTAQLVARGLAVSAEQLLRRAEDEAVRTVPTILTGGDREAIRRSLYEHLEIDLRFLLGYYGAIGGSNDDPESCARELRSGLTMLDILRSVGRHPIDLARPDYTPPFGSEETFALLKKRTRPLSVQEQLSQLTNMVGRISISSDVAKTSKATASGKSATKAPLFSAAADAYHELLRTTHGDRYDELKYIRHRKAIFLAVIGDRRVDEYTVMDLQHFINRVRHLPANHSKKPGFHLADVNQLIDENIKLGLRGLSKSTLMNNYVGKIKTIIKRGCSTSGVEYMLDEVPLIIPTGVPGARQKLLISHETLNAVFREGLRTGLLAEAILVLLGYLSGRRLGLLAHLRGDQIRRVQKHWIVLPNSHEFLGGEAIRAPVKTTESLGAFVLHEFLEQIGFTEWASRQSGYIFSALHEAADPADTASKRMARLLSAAGLDKTIHKGFHGLRHLRIAELREAGLQPRTIRMQVGHELAGVHDNYGDQSLRPMEIESIATVKLADDIDWSIFSKLDFDWLRANRLTARRIRRKKENLEAT